MATQSSFERFDKELNRLVATFAKNFTHYQDTGYDEASLRQEFLNPLFSALGWDVENKAGHIRSKREVEVESRTRIQGRQKRADYLFRAEAHDRFVCEAKKPGEKLDARYAFQAKRYAYNKDLALAVLTDFEEMKIFIVGGRPYLDQPQVGEWKTWHYKQYPLIAQELWNLLAREKVGGGSIERLLDSLPKRPPGKGKTRGPWIVKPDRSRALDTEFLHFLDKARKELASNLYKQNDRAELLEDHKLNEAVQRILDRIIFLRNCEDRDIDTGGRLQSLVETWRRAWSREEGSARVREDSSLDLDGGGGRSKLPRESLWHAVVAHFRALNRPGGRIPFFNGNLFKSHFSEELMVGDEWLAGFIGELSDEETPYLFNYISVEILGSVYERFLGKVVRPHGKGITVEEKPEVRKAGGVYYTPRYIVHSIVEQTVGKLLGVQPPEKTLGLRILDPACGSGSFLIRAFEQVCEHWQERLMEEMPADKAARAAWEKKNRTLCRVDADTGDIHLTVNLKRHILTQNIYGVDLDAAAVEVTQLSLYLKMLENENRTTLERERELFRDEKETALLPALQDNIKNFNSLIASDFSMMSEDLVRVRAADWSMQFASIMQAGGFDAVIGNPPYIRIQTMQESDADSVEYLNRSYAAAKKGNYDIYVCFVERALSLVNPNGTLGFILPHKFFNAQYGEGLREMISKGKHLRQIVHFGHQQVFEGATTYTCLLFLNRSAQRAFNFSSVGDLAAWATRGDGQVRRIECSDATKAEWNFISGPDAGLIDRLFALPVKLGGVAHLFVGLQTDADDVYIVEHAGEGANELVCSSKATGKQHLFERGHLKLLLKGSLNVRRYELDSVTKRLIFPYETVGAASVLIPEKDYKKRFPKTWRYLELNHSRLSKRNQGKQPDGWYSYIYKKNHTRFGSPKIVVPSLGTGSCFALDAAGDYFFVGSGAGGGGGYGIVPTNEEVGDIRFLLGLLNSRLLSFLIRKTSTPFRGGYIALNRQYIERLPIQLVDLKKPAGKMRHDKLVGLVDKLLGLMPKLRAATSDSEKATLHNAVTATDQQIDQLVYDLYALTPEEVALVERTAK